MVVYVHEEGLFENLDAQFFVELTAECRYARFALFQFATGEFPKTGERMVTSTLRNQDATIAVQKNSGGYLSWPWHCLYFLPEPQGQGSFLPTFFALLTNGVAVGAAAAAGPPRRPPAA